MINKLLYLNGLATISVVLNHASARGFISMFWWAHRYRPVGSINFDQFGNIEYYFLRMIEQLVVFTIPAFVFTSGYFVAVAAGRNDNRLGWDVALNRIKFLGIPFVLWSVVSLLYLMLQGDRYGPFDFFLRIVTGQAVPPFYFIPMLIQLYLLSPVLLFLIRRWWKPVLLVASIVQVLVLCVHYIAILRPDLKLYSNLTAGVLFSSHIFWFVLGIITGLNLAQYKKPLIKYLKLFLVGIIFFFIIGMIEWEMLLRFSGSDWMAPAVTLIDQLYALCVLLALLAYDNVQFPMFDRIASLGRRSYAIYLTHVLVLTGVSKAIYHAVPAVMEYQIVFLSILVVTAMGAPLILTYIVEKSLFREYYKYVFG